MEIVEEDSAASSSESIHCKIGPISDYYSSSSPIDKKTITNTFYSTMRDVLEYLDSIDYFLTTTYL